MPGSLGVGVTSFVMTYTTDPSPVHMADFLGVPSMDHKVHHKVTTPKKHNYGIGAIAFRSGALEILERSAIEFTLEIRSGTVDGCVKPE